MPWFRSRNLIMFKLTPSEELCARFIMKLSSIMLYICFAFCSECSIGYCTLELTRGDKARRAKVMITYKYQYEKRVGAK